MQILITGAFGFIGTNLSEAIKATHNHHLIAVDLYQPEKHAYGEFFDWNQLEKIDWSKVETIIHLAGKSHGTGKNANEKIFFDRNVGLTEKIFKYFAESNATKFIFFSSVKAVADSATEKILTELTLPNPQTPYGKSKLAAEKYILNYDLPKNKKVYILRPCMIHGPGNKGVLKLLCKLIQYKIPWPLVQFENKRSFTSIDNLIFVLKKILEKDISSGFYLMADDDAISTNRLIQLIAESNGKELQIWKSNKNVIYSITQLGDILHIPINSDSLKKLTEPYVVSNKKLKDTLGIHKMPVSAEEGMKKTLQSFKKQCMQIAKK